MKIHKHASFSGSQVSAAAIAAVAAAAGLGGCVSPDHLDSFTPLAELPGLALEVRYDHAPSIQIELQFDPEQLGGCVIAPPALTASFDGRPLHVHTWGRSEYVRDKWVGCTEPLLNIPMPAPSPSRFEVGDASLTITGEIGALLGPRDMAPVPDGPWTFVAGQAVTVRWTPAGDLAAAPPVVELDAAGVMYPLTPAVAGDLITFTLPEDVRGGAYLNIRLADEGAPIPCTGAPCRLKPGRFTKASRTIAIQ